MFCVTLSHRIHVSSPAIVAVSNSAVAGKMFTALIRPCIVSPSAPGVPFDGTSVVAIEPGTRGTNAAGSTWTGSLASGMFCRYESSPPTLTPAMLFAIVMPKMWMSSP